MQKLLEILQDVNADVDWAKEEAIIDDGLVDSFDIIALAGELSDQFGVTIELEHLEPENFNSVTAIAKLLQSLGADV